MLVKFLRKDSYHTLFPLIFRTTVWRSCELDLRFNDAEVWTRPNKVSIKSWFEPKSSLCQILCLFLQKESFSCIGYFVCVCVSHLHCFHVIFFCWGYWWKWGEHNKLKKIFILLLNSNNKIPFKKCNLKCPVFKYKFTVVYFFEPP